MPTTQRSLKTCAAMQLPCQAYAIVERSLEGKRWMNKHLPPSITPLHSTIPWSLYSSAVCSANSRAPPCIVLTRFCSWSKIPQRWAAALKTLKAGQQTVNGVFEFYLMGRGLIQRLPSVSKPNPIPYTEIQLRQTGMKENLRNTVW